MTLKLRDAGLLAGAMALLGMHFGCGRVANVLEGPDTGTRVAKGSSGSNGVAYVDSGVAGLGAGGGPPRLADGGTPLSTSQGGAPYGFGGKAGAPSFGGVAAYADASTGRGGNVGVPGALDPHGTERHELAKEMCALLDANECLQRSNYDPSAPAASDCQNSVERSEIVSAGNDCWNEWAANVRCALARTDFCPCSGNDCYFDPAGLNYGPDCAATYSALEACSHGNVGYGTVSGKLGTVWWHVDQNGCVTDWNGTYRDITSADCTGMGDSIQECSCTASGVFLGDESQYINESAYYFWYGSNCADVAQQVADGKCANILDCCFTWTYYEPTTGDVHDGGPHEECGCTADPKQAGYDSCEAIAAAGNGKVVDVCPRYVPNPGSFPGKPPQQ
jgi:hypothetical protein